MSDYLMAGIFVMTFGSVCWLWGYLTAYRNVTNDAIANGVGQWEVADDDKSTFKWNTEK